jgi:hypothetical protein
LSLVYSEHEGRENLASEIGDESLDLAVLAQQACSGGIRSGPASRQGQQAGDCQKPPTPNGTSRYAMD